MDLKIFLDFSAEAMENEADSNFSPMQTYFKNKNIFLTGGTGFLGLLYVEKLLRSDVKMIYLLVRTKKKVKPADRIKALYSGLLFEKLAKYDPNYLQRIRIIEGNLSELKLGINEIDLKDIYNNIDIVLHAAAEVRFDEKLIKLLLTNLRGTRELLKICENIKNLQIITYISTAYSNCYKKICDEQMYDSLADPNKMIEIAEKINTNSIANDEFEIITDRIINPFPNTYTFSKSLSETLVKQHAKKVPVCIIRPSIIISTHEDPIPAWSNNVYGLNGVAAGIGLGICRILPTKSNIICDIVCADFVVNSSLAATWYVNEKWTNKNNETIENPQVFHVNSSTDRPTNMGDINIEMNAKAYDDPPYKLLWKVCTNLTTCPFMLNYLTLWYHIIPSIFFDCYLALTNKQLRILPIYRKSQRFVDSLKYFMQNEWKFSNTNMKLVWDSMTPYDQEFYPSDVRRFDWGTYAYNYTLGLRKYAMNDPMEKRGELAKKKYKKIVYFHYLVLCIYYGIHILLFKTIANYFNIFGKLQDSIYDTVSFIKNPY